MPYSNNVTEGYFDYAAATPIDPELMAYHQEISQTAWANPSSLHAAGRAARGVLEEARRTVAGVLGAKSPEIVFLNSATTANNLVWRGLSGDIVSSTLEHASLASDMGRRVVRVSPDIRGRLDPGDILTALTPETRLVSVIWVQNELGTVQDIAGLARLLATVNREREGQGIGRVYLHTDAVQAPNYFSLDVESLGVDLLTLSAQKIYAPRGAAALYVRSRTPLQPLISGGGQERGLWSGTPDVASIATFAKALAQTQAAVSEQTRHARSLQSKLHDWARNRSPRVRLNSDEEFTSPGHVHLSLAEVNQEEILTYLDLHETQVSAGSSCASGAVEESAVVTCLRLSGRYAAHLRLTYGRATTVAEVDRLTRLLETYLDL